MQGKKEMTKEICTFDSHGWILIEVPEVCMFDSLIFVIFVSNIEVLFLYLTNLILTFVLSHRFDYLIILPFFFHRAAISDR